MTQAALPLFVIPTLQGIPDYVIRTRLDGIDFILRFLWNERTERWSMDILDIDSNPLAVGIIIITNRPLLRYYKYDSRLPAGELIAHDLVNQYGDPPGFDEMALNARVELTYYAATNF